MYACVCVCVCVLCTQMWPIWRPFQLYGEKEPNSLFLFGRMVCIAKRLKMVAKVQSQFVSIHSASFILHPAFVPQWSLTLLLIIIQCPFTILCHEMMVARRRRERWGRGQPCQFDSMFAYVFVSVWLTLVRLSFQKQFDFDSIKYLTDSKSWNGSRASILFSIVTTNR